MQGAQGNGRPRSGARRCCSAVVAAVLAAVSAAGGADGHTDGGDGRTVLSNTALPVDTAGNALVTGEAHVLAVPSAEPNGSTVFYAYFNNWPGGCWCGLPCTATAPPRCATKVCPQSHHADPAHTVVAYRTTNFAAWEPLGVVFSNPDGPSGNMIERPHVVYCNATRRYVLWYERYCSAGHCAAPTSFAVAAADHPEGPFASVTLDANTTNRNHDANVMVDDDGTAYHISLETLPCWPADHAPGRCAGLRIQRLSPDFASATAAQHFVNISATGAGALEAPVMFKRGGYYYATAGTLSCAAAGGTDVFAFKSRRPLGPYTPATAAADGRIFSREASRAQGSTVFAVGDRLVWLGNQWLTSASQERNHDLLRWALLDFDAEGSIKPMAWVDNITIEPQPTS